MSNSLHSKGDGKSMTHCSVSSSTDIFDHRLSTRIFDDYLTNCLMESKPDSSLPIDSFKMVPSSSVTLAICLFFGQAPSFTHANSLAVRQGTVDLQALKGAPLGRRNLPDIGLYSFHGAGGKREQGGYGSTGYSPKVRPHDGKRTGTYGQDGYDPSKVVVGSEKAVDPWGNDHYSLGEGKFDLGPGAHHSLSEGALDPGHESYGGSDSGAAISPQADASSSYGSEKKGYSSKPDKKVPSSGNGFVHSDPPSTTSSSDNSGKYDSKKSDPKKYDPKKADSVLKDQAKYDEPYLSGSSKGTGGTDYHQKKDPKDGKYASPDDSQKKAHKVEDTSSEDDGHFIFEAGTTEEQRKAAQKEADEATKHSKKNQEGSTSYGAQVEPTGEKKNAGDQSYSQPHITDGHEDGNSSYA
ncbi:hypothetical protein KEM48_004392 [Puccinia striiformis f. sp. tritici PST-130]|nr:hypothetical protein KEM48_004392 [Puccinia striiformis f. sp. tritici PST-130]